MSNFVVNVVPKTENGRIPAALAGQIMIDIQQMLSDIGEYIVRREMGVQNSINPEILSRFVLYMDGDGGIAIGTSTDAPEIGSVTQDAIELMERTMDAMGSGTGGYWMEDTYADPFFRNNIIYDIVALSEHINGYPDCSFMYGTPENLKTFGRVDVARLDAFIKNKGWSADGATIGLITSTMSKSKGQILGFECGTDKVKLHFKDRSVENAARDLLGKGAVYVAGRLMYSREGNLLEIRDAYTVTPAQTIRFRRLVSPSADVTVNEPVVANVLYDGKWHIKHEELGVSVSKDTWDETVQEFNNYFMFLWSEYIDEDRELVGEDAEIRETLRKYL